jgi:hypothetical protein
MSFIQRPIIAGRYERPLLPRLADVEGLVIHMIDRPPDFVGVIEKDFPAAAARPSRMIDGKQFFLLQHK